MAPRCLLIGTPSIAAHPERLDQVYEIHDRSSTDLQMLDRIAAGLVNLPAATYHVVLLLADADGTTRESHKLFSRDVMNKVASALKVGGVLKSQAGPFQGAEKTEAILAGLTETADGMAKPEQEEPVSIPLKFGKKKANGVNATNGTNGAVNPDGSVL
ncbi:electron carrier [Pyrenophora teres f. teres]|nr:electron carrier [Pyrenophora teres f. teres]